MSLTQFAMVEELAFLIKDNLPCKHLVLYVEKALIDFLQDDASLDGVLELEPMNSYNRLLLHRLADIFGFSHHSVGEGDDRHLILERCPDTSIPSILISDLLWQYDEFQSPTVSPPLISRREEASPELKAERPTSQISLEEREAAYLAARERIFSVNEGETKGAVKQKPRNNPVVARRMIAHALGQRIKPPNQVVCLRDTKEYEEHTDEMSIQEEKEGATNLSNETYQQTDILSGRNVNLHGKLKVREPDGSALSHTERKVTKKLPDKASTDVGISGPGRNDISIQKVNLKQEHLGAAKRMFAQALGFHSTRDSILSKCSETKHTDRGSFE